MVVARVGTARVDYYHSTVVLIKNLIEIGRQVSEPFSYSLCVENAFSWRATGVTSLLLITFFMFCRS